MACIDGAPEDFGYLATENRSPSISMTAASLLSALNEHFPVFDDQGKRNPKRAVSNFRRKPCTWLTVRPVPSIRLPQRAL